MSLPVAIAGLLGGAFLVLSCGTGFDHPKLAAQSLPEPQRWFITQNQNPLYHPEPTQPYNSNCGPAALAMALKAFGIAPAGYGPQALIRYARELMTGSIREGTWTYPDQIVTAARKAGLEAREVFGIQGIRSALSHRGSLVVANVNPGGTYDDLLAERYAGGHFTVVYDVRGAEFLLNDPLAERPALAVSVQTFEKALLADLGPGKPAYDGGVELRRPDGTERRPARARVSAAPRGTAQVA